MDFETSCWGTGSLTNGGETFFNFENPVQRRPKIDYFDSTSVTPIVSHISSNGYYGYCPTMNTPACIEIRSSNGPKNATDIDFSVPDITPMDLTNSGQTQHQGRSMFGNRKRAVQCFTDEFAEQDAKRRRSHLSVIDYAEDTQMAYDDEKDTTFDSSKNIAFNKLPIEQFIFCIDQLEMERNSNKISHTSDQSSFGSKSKPIRSDVKKTDDNSDMENLYWHTHGSLLWQR